MVENLNGPTCSSTGYSGPLGKAQENVSLLKLNRSFKRFVANDNLPKLPDEVAYDLSTDQKHSYKLLEAIMKEEVSPELDVLACSKMHHAR